MLLSAQAARDYSHTEALTQDYVGTPIALGAAMVCSHELLNQTEAADTWLCHLVVPYWFMINYF